MRSKLREMKGHGGLFACEYCNAKATNVNIATGYNADGSDKVLLKPKWPESTFKAGKARTHARLKHIAETLDDRDEDRREGVIGKSLFFDYPDFDVIHHMPAEYM